MAVTVIVQFRAQPGKREALLDLLRGVQSLAIENGCRSIAVHRDLGSDDGVFEVEYWDSKAAHERFVGVAMERGMLAPLEGLLEAPFAAHHLEPVLKTDA